MTDFLITSWDWLVKVLTKFVTYLPYISFAASIVILFWKQRNAAKSAAKAHEKNLSLNRISKFIDVTIHCTTRYNELRARQEGILAKAPGKTISEIKKLSESLDSKLAGEIDSYFSAYWALQGDQFDFWVYGALDHDTFFDWSYYLAVKIIQEKKEGGSALKDSWNKWSDGGNGASHRESNPQFVRYINTIFRDCIQRANGNESVSGRKIADIILNLMEILEGVPDNMGFAREYRQELWKGMDFVKFKELITRDLDVTEEFLTKPTA